MKFEKQKYYVASSEHLDVNLKCKGSRKPSEGFVAVLGCVAKNGTQDLVDTGYFKVELHSQHGRVLQMGVICILKQTEDLLMFCLIPLRKTLFISFYLQNRNQIQNMLETMRLVGKPLLKPKEETEMVIGLEKGESNERRGQCVRRLVGRQM